MVYISTIFSKYIDLDLKGFILREYHSHNKWVLRDPCPLKMFTECISLNKKSLEFACTWKFTLVQ